MNLAIPKEGQSLCLKVRKELGERAQILKEQWLLEKKALPSKYDYRRKKHVKPDPKWGFLHRCAEENFPALHDFPTVSMAFFFFFFGPCLTKSSVFLIKILSRILTSQLGSSREPDFFIPLTIFKNKYHQPSFKMLFISFVHSAFFNCCSLPEQIHTGKLLIFQPTL